MNVPEATIVLALCRLCYIKMDDDLATPSLPLHNLTLKVYLFLADNKGIARGLATWREAVSRCNTSAQLAMLLQALEAAIAWDKSIMKAVRMRHVRIPFWSRVNRCPTCKILYLLNAMLAKHPFGIRTS